VANSYGKHPLLLDNEPYQRTDVGKNRVFPSNQLGRHDENNYMLCNVIYCTIYSCKVLCLLELSIEWFCILLQGEAYPELTTDVQRVSVVGFYSLPW